MQLCPQRFAGVLVLLASSAMSVFAQLHERPLQPVASGVEVDELFQEIPISETGIDFVHRWNPPAKHRDQLTNAFSGSGVAVGDYDKDGLPDIFLCGQTQGGQLYKNLDDFRFSNRSASLTPAAPEGTWATGATWADVDNDGWLDLYVCGFDCPNRLYFNRAKGRERVLVESAKAFGVDHRGASITGTFADYDRDGDLDLFVVTNRMPAPLALREEKFSLSRGSNGEPVLPEAFRQYADMIVMPDGSLKKIDAGQYDHLYRNEGPNKPFTEVTQDVGMGGNHYGLSATWWDWNDDSWPDLYVANDFFGPDQLWTNNGPDAQGKVTFTDMTKTSLPHTPWFSMGADIADINNDGLFDLLATDMAGSTHYNEKMQMGNMSGPDSDAWFLNFPTPPQYMRNAFYLNSGTEHFMEVAALLGVSKTDWTWSVNFGDLDNDGNEDLFVTNGMSRDWLNSDLSDKAPSRDGWDTYYDFWYAQKPLKQSNRVFRNGGDLKMTEAGKVWGLNKHSVSFGAALSDLNGDGALDIVMNNFNGPPTVYRNQGSSKNRLAISLVGTSSNRFGLGTKVEVRLQDSSETLTRYLTSARGFMSAPDPVIHFGLGESAEVAQLTVRWPSGHRQQFENLAAGAHYTITEPSGKPKVEKRPKLQPLFAENTLLQGIRHREEPYDDFARQPLLPTKHSQLGPGIAFADVDGDGQDDFYLAQGAGTPGQVYVRKKSPNKGANAFAQHATSEDITPLFFDAEGDGDQDLLVVSGGVEGEAGAAVFKDRLYLNDGGGTFTHAPAALPNMAASGGPAAAADFDKDGDLDLFIGGRVIPGRYPEAPQSQLLRNESSKENVRFIDLGMESLGMVTAAVWADTNGDTWPDLVVATEWGPIQVFENLKGTLAKPRHDNQSGWWSSLAAADVDGDGDIDLVAGNVGLNTKYKAPELLYYGDFDGTGKPRILEAKFEGETWLPHRGYSCSSNAMPALKSKLTTFHSFANKSLEAIYSNTRLKNALRFEANTLESGVFLNDGKGRFRFQPLPRLAQAFPVYGIVVEDLTSDGHPDVYLIGNSNSPQRETGNMDGGVSLLLAGDGKGNFRPMWPHESGLVVPGDAKGVVLTDLNGDLKRDIVVTVNNSSLRAFLAR